MTNYIIIPLGINAHEYARNFAEKTPDDFRDNYLTSLAVYAIHRYLGNLDIPANLGNGRDLSLEIGKIFCQLVDPHTATLSPIDKNSRDGVFARFALRTIEDIGEVEDIYEVEILGFTENLAATIPIANLSTIEAFIDRLESWELEKIGEVQINDDWMKQIVDLFPQVTLAKLTTWIDEAFSDDRLGSFVNSLESKILGDTLIPAEGYRKSGNGGNFEENPLREILANILAQKKKAAGIVDDDDDIDDDDL
jgi:hypothetical protein